MIQKFSSLLLKPRFSEAVVQRCSVKTVFLEILQNSQENTRARVSFLIKLQTLSYFVNLRIQSEFRKIRTRNDSVFGHFSRSDSEYVNLILSVKYPYIE